jgi:hypothetical protein
VKVPVRGGWRRKLIGGVVLLVSLPLLLAVVLDTVTRTVQLVDRIVGVVWPWVVGMSVGLLALRVGYILLFRRWR